MASSATDILSLADAKHEFQVEDSDVSEDTRVGGIINQAVSLVGRLSGLPLVDREQKRVRSPTLGGYDRSSAPAILARQEPSVSVKYWEERGARCAPSRHTLLAGLWGGCK